VCCTPTLIVLPQAVSTLMVPYDQVHITEKCFTAEKDMFYHPGEQFSRGAVGGAGGGDVDDDTTSAGKAD
jgi:hypothetical protein